jgi:monoamine oxidase
MNENDRLQEIKREIEMVHGLPQGYLDGIVTDNITINWNEEPWFRGALCMYTPEQKRLFSVASANPEYNNRVFFAGEHVSAKHRWMQGALKSGMEAANELAGAFKIKYGVYYH